MSPLLLSNEPLLRIGSFIFILLVMLSLEGLIPYRPNTAKKTTRWVSNMGMAVLSTLMIRLLSALPLALLPVSFALFLQDHPWGLFHWLSLGSLWTFFLTLIFLDLVIYGQHVIFHHVPLLWRLHRVHHTDVNLDTTSGVRFHPVEIFLSLCLKLLAIGLLGAPAAGVIAFEILLNGTALFNHSNIKLPKGLDRFLRLIVVTPDMHRVHHSTLPKETNSNFGFNLPWWDWLFRTYKAQPRAGHLNMTIGLTDFPSGKRLTLLALLALPFNKRF
ncbi:MAG TPA: hypothetical protein DD412_03165 [Holosporales bacterium]|nr:hypothetical protein [Holosporales bacterium]